jgi:hypothetical protein
MARCPNCAAKILWDAAECASCQALFNAGSAWKIEPETWEERQNLERRPARTDAPALPAPPPAEPQLVLGFSFVGGLLLFAITASVWSARSALMVVIGYGALLGGAGLVALILRYGAMTMRAGLLLFGCVFALAGVAAWDIVPAPVGKFTSSREHGVDRRGVPYRLFGTRYETACGNECGRDSNCEAWTWYLRRPGGMTCALMSKAGSPRPDACCISGVISRE